MSKIRKINKMRKKYLSSEIGSAVAQCRVFDSRPKGRVFEAQWCHGVVVLEQDTLS